MFFCQHFFRIFVGFECDDQLLQAEFAKLCLALYLWFDVRSAEPRKRKTTPDRIANMEVERLIFEVVINGSCY